VFLYIGPARRTAACARCHRYGCVLEYLGSETCDGSPIPSGRGSPRRFAVALVSYELWQRLFAGNSTVIGQQLKLEEGNYTIVGVLPRGFNIPFAAEVWVPLQINIETLPLDQRKQPGYDFVARLKDNVTLGQADAELKEIARSLEQEYPQFRRGWSYKLISLGQNLIGDLEGRNRRALFALIAAVAFVLLICCANLANLLLARGIAREREISIRFALGAARSQIVRQVLAESLLLALLGGFAGLISTYWIAPILGAWSPVQAVSLGTFLRDFRIDTNVVVFCN
jgi:putative ABC transport system permease protein